MPTSDYLAFEPCPTPSNPPRPPKSKRKFAKLETLFDSFTYIIGTLDDAEFHKPKSKCNTPSLHSYRMELLMGLRKSNEVTNSHLVTPENNVKNVNRLS
jgi:hypothetical protein